jgi:hypothetical protein
VALSLFPFYTGQRRVLARGPSSPDNNRWVVLLWQSDLVHGGRRGRAPCALAADRSGRSAVCCRRRAGLLPVVVNDSPSTARRQPGSTRTLLSPTILQPQPLLLPLSLPLLLLSLWSSSLFEAATHTSNNPLVHNERAASQPPLLVYEHHLRRGVRDFRFFCACASLTTSFHR